MSKSLGNFVTIRQLFEGWQNFNWTGDVVRLAMLSAHYRQPIDWTRSRLLEAQVALARWHDAAIDMHPSDIAAQGASLADFGADSNSQVLQEILSDDLNTPRAIAHLHALSANAERNLDAGRSAIQLHYDCELLGLDLRRYRADWAEAIRGRTPETSDIDEKRVEALIAARLAARAAKNWAESDRIRDELAAMGIALKDGKGADGQPVTTWEVRR